MSMRNLINMGFRVLGSHLASAFIFPIALEILESFWVSMVSVAKLITPQLSTSSEHRQQCLKELGTVLSKQSYPI
jgi:hypothetical protein